MRLRSFRVPSRKNLVKENKLNSSYSSLCEGFLIFRVFLFSIQLEFMRCVFAIRFLKSCANSTCDKRTRQKTLNVKLIETLFFPLLSYIACNNKIVYQQFSAELQSDKIRPSKYRQSIIKCANVDARNSPQLTLWSLNFVAHAIGWCREMFNELLVVYCMSRRIWSEHGYRATVICFVSAQLQLRLSQVIRSKSFTRHPDVLPWIFILRQLTGQVRSTSDR